MFIYSFILFNLMLIKSWRKHFNCPKLVLGSSGLKFIIVSFFWTFNWKYKRPKFFWKTANYKHSTLCHTFINMLKKQSTITCILGGMCVKEIKFTLQSLYDVNGRGLKKEIKLHAYFKLNSLVVSCCTLLFQPLMSCCSGDLIIIILLSFI